MSKDENSESLESGGKDSVEKDNLENRDEMLEPLTPEDGSRIAETPTALELEAASNKKGTPEKKSESGAKGSQKQKQTEAGDSDTNVRWGFLFRSIVFLALLSVIAGVAVLGYYVHLELKKQEELIVSLEQQISDATNVNKSSLDQINITQSGKTARLVEQLRATQTQLGDLEQRVMAQGKRLLAMTDTSRDDWLLAEAEYLLKLANQRVRIEKSSDGAEALLEEADEILRDQDDPDLHPLRRAIAKDLAALRLATKIDIEGIYLSLVGLAEQVENLPLRLSHGSETKSALPSIALEEKQELAFTQKIKTSWQRFLNSFDSYFRVIRHDKPPQALLTPEDSHYLQQNLRLILERAQLALLREQQKIYNQSLAQADNWVQTYYPESMPTLSFRKQLKDLNNETVVQQLPDISRSLELLHEYIENLHKLKGTSSRDSSVRTTDASAETE